MRTETSFVVSRPIEEAWAFLTDPFNLPRIRGAGWLGVRQISPGPMGFGSTFEARVAIFGFERRMSLACTEWAPPHAVTLSVTGAGFRSGYLRLTVEATADGTKVVRTSELEPRSGLKPLWWIVWPLMTRRSDASNRTLKRLLEAGRD